MVDDSAPAAERKVPTFGAIGFVQQPFLLAYFSAFSAMIVRDRNP
jgi:hypothetical protein